MIAPLFVIFPLSFNAEEFLVFSEGMKNLDPDAFSLRWYKDMIYGTKNPWGLAAKNSFIIAIFATIGSIILGTLAALGLSSRHMPYKGIIMATLISPMIVPLIISGVAIFFFMGDVGSIPLGATVGLVSIIIKQEILLLILGGIFVVEALSVIIQITSFKLYKKRIFRMAPLHHHFEQLGCSESKIVIRFWIVSIILALISIASLKIR